MGCVQQGKAYLSGNALAWQGQGRQDRGRGRMMCAEDRAGQVTSRHTAGAEGYDLIWRQR